MQIIVMGPPGSGKGTQAKIIEKTFNLTHISSGDLLRNNPNLPQEIRDIMNSGAFPPDEMMLDLVKLELDRCTSGWILDGFPRTLNQAKMLEKMYPENVKIIYFHIDEAELVNRLTGRLTCPKCGKIYHSTANPPKTPGICDDDGSTLTQRKDDTEEVVKNRLAVYREKTAPIIDYYNKKSLLQTIEAGGSNSIDSIFSNITKILSS